MRRYPSRIIILFLLLPLCSLSQNRSFTTYRYGDSCLVKAITKNLLSYHDEEIVFSNRNILLTTVVYVSANGKIDSISTLNSTRDKESEAIIDAIFRTKADWLESREPYKVVIPFYIIHSSNNPNEVIINISDVIPINKAVFPFKGIFLKPVIIHIGPKVR